MKSKNLLTQLSDLEDSLDNFSFEELSTEEASRLQRSFMTFKIQLERKVWGEPEQPQENEPYFPGSSAEDLPVQQKELGRIASVCHHMRTPINGIIGSTDLLKESKLTPDQQYQLNAIQSASQVLMDMVNELTEFSRLKAGLESFERVSFNIYNLVEDVKYLCETLIVDERLTLRVEMDSAIPRMLTGDPSKLSEVLLHLLGYSLKNLYKGHMFLDARFIYQEEERVFLEFQISTRATGNPHLQKQHKAKMNSSVKPAFQKTTDTGLGLSIVQQIISKLGGELYQKNSQHEGPFFVFRLPFTKANRSLRKHKQDRSDDILTGLKVLVIETNPLNQQVIERRLRTWGCVVLLVENEEQLPGLLDKTEIDLIIVDLKSVSDGGKVVMGKIRTHSGEKIRALPVIALGIPPIEEEIKDSVAFNYTDQIQKPYGADDLKAKLLLYASSKKKSAESIPSIMNRDSTQKEKLPVLDLAPVLEDCLGNMDTLEELVDHYKQKALEFVGSVKLHLDRSDFKGIAYSCQKITSSLKLFRTENLLNLVDQMYKTSNTNQDIRHLKFLHLCFMNEYPETEAALNEALALLQKKNRR